MTTLRKLPQRHPQTNANPRSGQRSPYKVASVIERAILALLTSTVA
jgi:hypothetical protein